MAALTATRAKHSTIPAISASVAETTKGAGPSTNEVQTITLDDGVIATGGTFTLTYSGQTTSAIAYDADAATILAALEALSNIEDDHIAVSGSLNEGIVVTFGAVVTITASVATTTPGAGPSTDEVQTISLGVDQVATGGTFTLTYSGQTTSAIAYDADAATIDAALEALSNIGEGDVSVTGDLNSDIVITFGGALAATDVAECTVDVSATTGVSALSAADVAALTVSVASTTGTVADAVTFTLSATDASRIGNTIVVVNRDTDDAVTFKVGASDPGEIAPLADDAYVVPAGKESQPIPIDNLASFVVRVAGVPTAAYSVHLIPG